MKGKIHNCVYPDVSRWDREESYQRYFNRTIFGLDYLLKKEYITQEIKEKLTQMWMSGDQEMRSLAMGLAAGIWAEVQKRLSPQSQKLLK